MNLILLMVLALFASVEGFCSDPDLMCNEEMPRKTTKRPVPLFNEEPLKKAKPSNQSGSSLPFPVEIHQIISEMCPLSDWFRQNQTCKGWHNLLRETLQNKILIMGPYGSGKSTLLNLLLGNPLVAGEFAFLGFNLRAREAIPNLIISGLGTSKPAPVLDFANKRIIIDCPGFSNDLNKDWVNTPAFPELLKGNVSVVLVVEKDLMFAHVMTQMTEIFPNQNQLKTMLSLVVSKQRDVLSITDYLKGRLAVRTTLVPRSLRLVQYLMDHPNMTMEIPLTPRSRDLLQHLIDHPNRTLSFRAPVAKGPYPTTPELQSLLDSCGYVHNPTVRALARESEIPNDRDGHQGRVMIGYPRFGSY